MADLGRTLKYLYPDGGWEVGDDPHDGLGPRITRWDLPIPQPSPAVISAAHANALRADAVMATKAEAGRRILARFPDWKQANMTARAVEIVAAKQGRLLSETETAEETALHAAWAWIKAVRSRSDEIETSLADLPLEQLQAFDPAAENWPTPPA